MLRIFVYLYISLVVLWTKLTLHCCSSPFNFIGLSLHVPKLLLFMYLLLHTIYKQQNNKTTGCVNHRYQNRFHYNGPKMNPLSITEMQSFDEMKWDTKKRD